MKPRPSDDNGKTILFVDDHPVVREGLGALLRSSRTFSTVLEADTLDAARALLRTHQPDLVLLDIALRGESGFELLREMPVLCPGAKTVVLSLYEEGEVIRMACELGASAFISKSVLSLEILATLDAVLAGEILFPRHVQKVSPCGPRPTAVLSKRELAIYLEIGRGHPVGIIAQNLGISPRTVESHRERIKAKLRIQSAADLLRHAVLFLSNLPHDAGF